MENKSGRLTEVTEVLAKEGVNLSALCIAENADFGILRGIVSEPDKAYKALKDNHFAVNVTDVVGISCPNIPGSLAKVLRCLSDEGVFIEYMYSFANGQTANVIIRPNDMENCIRVLTEKRWTCWLRATCINCKKGQYEGYERECAKVGIPHSSLF